MQWRIPFMLKQRRLAQTTDAQCTTNTIWCFEVHNEKFNWIIFTSHRKLILLPFMLQKYAVDV